MQASIKKYMIGAGIGAVLTAVIAYWWWNTNPRIVIKKETATETVVVNKPTDYQSALDCVISKGDITETIDQNNIMHIVYKDKCKKATKDVELKSYDRNKHFLIFNISNTFSKDKFVNYGASVHYYQMLYTNFGLGGGVAVNSDSATPCIGAIFSW